MLFIVGLSKDLLGPKMVTCTTRYRGAGDPISQDIETVSISRCPTVPDRKFSRHVTVGSLMGNSTSPQNRRHLLLQPHQQSEGSRRAVGEEGPTRRHGHKNALLRAPVPAKP
jgi:hypothetical protein